MNYLPIDWVRNDADYRVFNTLSVKSLDRLLCGISAWHLSVSATNIGVIDEIPEIIE